MIRAELHEWFVVNTPVPLHRILCVDDNSMLLQTLVFAFKEYPFEVVTAAHGVDALMQFQTYDGDFAAILTDNDMPKMNGVALVKYLRALDYTRPILVMSGHLSSADSHAYQSLEVSGFLHKPFEIGLLASMLLESLNAVKPSRGGLHMV